MGIRAPTWRSRASPPAPAPTREAVSSPMPQQHVPPCNVTPTRARACHDRDMARYASASGRFERTVHKRTTAGLKQLAGWCLGTSRERDVPSRLSPAWCCSVTHDAFVVVMPARRKRRSRAALLANAEATATSSAAKGVMTSVTPRTVRNPSIKQGHVTGTRSSAPRTDWPCEQQVVELRQKAWKWRSLLHQFNGASGRSNSVRPRW